MPFLRISLRASLVGIAVVTFGLFGGLVLLPILWLLGMGDGTDHGPNTDILEPGRAVVLAAEFRAAPSSRVIKPTGHTDFKEVMDDWPGTTPEGELAIAKGTRGSSRSIRRGTTIPAGPTGPLLSRSLRARIAGAWSRFPVVSFAGDKPCLAAGWSRMGQPTLRPGSAGAEPGAPGRPYTADMDS